MRVILWEISTNGTRKILIEIFLWRFSFVFNIFPLFKTNLCLCVQRNPESVEDQDKMIGPGFGFHGSSQSFTSFCGEHWIIQRDYYDPWGLTSSGVLLCELATCTDCRHQNLTSMTLPCAVGDWLAGESERDNVVAKFGAIEDWDTSRVRNLKDLFKNTDFNEGKFLLYTCAMEPWTNFVFSLFYE